MQYPKYSVVQVIDQLNIGGTERVLVTLSNLLYEHGHNVSVITTVATGPLASQLNKNISVINLHRKWKWSPVTMYRLIQAIKGFDIIHVHSSYNLRYVYLAAKLFGLRRQVFFHEHYGDIHINPSVAWHQKFIYPRVIFICVSKQLALWAEQQLMMPSGKIFILPNTVIKSLSLPRLKRAGVQKNILLVSNFRPTKNIGFAIELFEQLIKEQTENFRLDIIGQAADKTYHEHIIEMINAKGLSNYISIISNCNEIQPLLAGYDLALHAAKSESGPLVLIEYLAQSLPFLSYETGEVAAQIKNDLPEFVISTFNIDEWIRAIHHLLNADTQVLQSRMAAVFEKYFSEESYYEKCIAIYKAGLRRDS